MYVHTYLYMYICTLHVFSPLSPHTAAKKFRPIRKDHSNVRPASSESFAYCHLATRKSLSRTRHSYPHFFLSTIPSQAISAHSTSSHPRTRKSPHPSTLSAKSIDCANQTAQPTPPISLAPEEHFMQSGLTEHSNRESQTNQPYTPSTTASQHGSSRTQPRSGSGPEPQPGLPAADCRARSTSPDGPGRALDVSELDYKLDGLNTVEDGTSSSARYRLAAAAGQRISDYENASVMLSSKRHSPQPAVTFKVVNGQRSSDGVRLTDFPNGSSCLLLSFKAS